MINYKCEDKRADLLSGGETKRLAQTSGQHVIEELALTYHND